MIAFEATPLIKPPALPVVSDDDVDENYDGIPDNQQPHLFPPYVSPYQVLPMPPQYLLPYAPPQYYYGQLRQEGQPSTPQQPAQFAPISAEERLRAAREGHTYAVHTDGRRERIDVPGRQDERSH